MVLARVRPQCSQSFVAEQELRETVAVVIFPVGKIGRVCRVDTSNAWQSMTESRYV